MINPLIEKWEEINKKPIDSEPEDNLQNDESGKSLLQKMCGEYKKHPRPLLTPTSAYLDDLEFQTANEAIKNGKGVIKSVNIRFEGIGIPPQIQKIINFEVILYQ